MHRVDVRVTGSLHEQARRRQVGRVSGIDAQHGIRKRPVTWVEGRIVVYLVPREPSLALVLDEVEVLDEKGRQECRIVLRLRHVLAQGGERLDGSQARIGLDPTALVLPFLALVKLEDERDEPLRLVSGRLTVEPLARVLILGVEDAVPDETVRGDLQNKRLSARRRALNRQVVEIAVLHGRKLIDNRTRDIKSV